MQTLTEQHRAQLAAVSDDIIAERGYVSVPPGGIQFVTERTRAWSDRFLRTVLHGGALMFPLYRLGAPQPYCYVLRPDQPRRSQKGKVVKYEYPRNTPNIFDVLPRYRDLLTNPDAPAIITEGTKKADALASAYGSRALIINENGVFGWRSRGRMVDDIRSIVWEGRQIIIIPDGDVRHNQQVFDAIRRSVAVFRAFGARQVLVCLLPQDRDGEKIGIDDYLAAGHTIADIESHLVELDAVTTSVRVSLMKHPQTGAQLYLPGGYEIVGQTIHSKSDDGRRRQIYSGLLIVTEIGEQVQSGEQIATVAWRQNGRISSATITRAQMAVARDVATVLGAHGAHVHAQNARDISRYLVEFISENHESIPVVRYIDRLGVCADGLVLPAGCIGLNARYTGPSIRCGDNRDAYPSALRTIAGWERTDIIWLTLALALAGPAIARLRKGHNPVVLLAGSSGAGKSTLVHFSIGQFGDPTRSPLQVQCGSGTTTAKGIAQTLAQLFGVPTHLEDVHMLMQRDPSRVAGLIYDFANGQLRTYGTPDQQAGGGNEIGGCLLLTGEMLPEFQYEGSARRTLVVNCVTHPPLGAPPRSREGAARAALLDRAWQSGAGLFALQVYERIWRDWASFQRDVERLAADESLAEASSWRHIMAAAAVVLQCAAQAAGVAIDVYGLMRRWSGMHAQSARERDPAREAFDRVLLMLSQCEMTDNSDVAEDAGGRRVRIEPTWRWLNYDRKMVAAQRAGENYWRVATGTLAWRTMVGPGAVDQFGAAWLRDGLILPHRDGRASGKVYMGELRSSTQCILVPGRWFEDID